MNGARDTVRTDERTTYEAKLDIQYAICLSERHCALYRHLDKGIRFITAFFASGAVATTLSTWPRTALALGVATAACAALAAVVDLGALTRKHDEDRRAFLGLLQRADGLSLAQVDKALVGLRKKAAPTLRGLEYPAYNDMVRQVGRTDYLKSLTRWETFLRILS